MIPISRAPKRFVAALNKFRSTDPHRPAAINRGLSRVQALSSTTIGDKKVSVGHPGASPSASLSTAVQLAHEVDEEAAATAVQVAKDNIRLAEIADFDAQVARLHQTRAENENKTAQEASSTGARIELYGPRGDEWWTGLPPVHGVCPGVDANNRIHSLPQISCDPATLTRSGLQAYFDNTWTLTETLFASLQGPEAFIRPPYHDLRHPMIFYYGHPAALYVNKLRCAGLLTQPINAHFERIFETGVDEMSWDDLSKNRMPWPSVEEVHAYRKQVYEAVRGLILGMTDADLRGAIRQDESPYWALLMGFEHERIHLETSSVLINELPQQYVRFPEGFAPYHPCIQPAEERVTNPVLGRDYQENVFVDVPAQRVTLGKARDAPSFGWDNEYGRRELDVPAFRATQNKISNAEFLAFVQDNGYNTSAYWTATGWRWKAYRNAKWPSFWVRNGPQGLHDYTLRVLFDTVAMPWSAPVTVNFHEAQAYANWKAHKTGRRLRLMTEPEHHAIRDPNPPHADHALHYDGPAMLSTAHFNCNVAYSSVSPPQTVNSKGFADVFGNAWEWMLDYFCALPGFQVHRFYEDFSTPCFDGLHQVIQGGSFISTGNETSTYARFHFRPHFFQHASFRLVESHEDHLLHSRGLLPPPASPSAAPSTAGDSPVGFAADDLQSETAVVTSDRDAPGPYVGAYPFRRSRAFREQQQALAEEAAEEGAVQHVVAKHFGHLSETYHSAFSATTMPSQVVGPLPTSSPTASFSLQQLHRYLVTSSSLPKHYLSATSKVLEVNCGVGGLSDLFHRVDGVHRVIGTDHDQRLVQIARQIQKTREGVFTLRGAGDTSSSHPFALPAPSNTSSSSSSLDFRVCDPMCLPAEYADFDLVVLHDVLALLSSPNSLLGRLHGLTTAGGWVVVLDRFQWDANRTPKELWLGGYRPSADAALVSSEETLIQRMEQEGFRHVPAPSYSAAATSSSASSSSAQTPSWAQVPVFFRDSRTSVRGDIYSLLCFQRVV